MSHTRTVDDHAADLLQEVLRAARDLVDIPPDNPAAPAACSVRGDTAWLAYRLLGVLERTNPQLLEDVLDDYGHEIADDLDVQAQIAAVARGHNPKRWAREYEQWLAENAAVEARAA